MGWIKRLTVSSNQRVKKGGYSWESYPKYTPTSIYLLDVLILGLIGLQVIQGIMADVGAYDCKLVTPRVNIQDCRHGRETVSEKKVFQSFPDQPNLGGVKCFGAILVT